ncbi:hypothetical protein AVEN_51743-1, partial [Araneus ventricosus]
KNLTKDLARSISSENFETKNNCASKHMPYTPRKSASLTSTPQSSCSETKRIAVPFGFVFSLFPNISDPCLSKMFEDSYPRVSTSPTAVTSNTPATTGSTSQSAKFSFSLASRTSISPDIRVCASSAVRTSFSPAKGLHDLPANGMHASPSERVHDSPAKRMHASPAEIMHASPAERMHDSPAKRMHALPAEKVHDSPAKRKSVKLESQFVINYACCNLSSASLNNYEEQTETRACTQHSVITLKAENILQDAVSLKTDQGSFVATSKISTDIGTFSPEAHSFSFKDSDSPGCLRILTSSQASISKGSVSVADSEDFNYAIAAKGSNRIPTVHSRIFPKQLFLSDGDADESVSRYEYERSKGPTGSIHVKQGNFSESSLRNLEATSHKPITYSGTIVDNLLVGEISNCSSSSRSQHKTEYLTEKKTPPSRSPSNLVGNYESPAGPLPGAALNVVQASDDMTKGNVLGRSVFSKYAASIFGKYRITLIIYGYIRMTLMSQ